MSALPLKADIDRPFWNVRKGPKAEICANVCQAGVIRLLVLGHAIVIGPTPPGTGVTAPATCMASAKATSPTIRVFPPSPGTRLIPTSMMVAPDFIQSPRTISGRPMAATSRSAPRQTEGRSSVFEWVMVTVAFSASRSCATGFPTMFERPITTALRPVRVSCTVFWQG